MKLAKVVRAIYLIALIGLFQSAQAETYDILFSCHENDKGYAPGEFGATVLEAIPLKKDGKVITGPKDLSSPIVNPYEMSFPLGIKLDPPVKIGNTGISISDFSLLPQSRKNGSLTLHGFKVFGDKAVELPQKPIQVGELCIYQSGKDVSHTEYYCKSKSVRVNDVYFPTGSLAALWYASRIKSDGKRVGATLAGLIGKRTAVHLDSSREHSSCPVKLTGGNLQNKGPHELYGCDRVVPNPTADEIAKRKLECKDIKISPKDAKALSLDELDELFNLEFPSRKIIR